MAAKTEDHLAAYKADCKLRKLKYPGRRSYYIKEFLAGLDGCDICEVGKPELKAYLSKLQERGLRYVSLESVFYEISGFYEFLVEEELIASNPVKKFMARYIRTYKKQLAQDNRQLISIEEASHLVTSILDSRDIAMITLLLKTGMRAGELLALDIGDIDMQKMEIRLKPVSKRSNRLLFFDDETAEALHSWHEVRKNRNGHDSMALFPSKCSGRLSQKGLEYIVWKHAERVGLHDPDSDMPEKRFFPHCCPSAYHR